MDLHAHIDIYCERTDPSFWSEPINALSNAAFLIAALILWRRTGGNLEARVLCGVLAAIGIGSFLFHTFATNWAMLADVIPIGVFILTYLFLASRDFLGLPLWGAALATLGFLPYAALLVPVLDRLPFFHISNFYWTVPILLGAYAWLLRQRAPATARGMLIGAGVLCLSIAIRSVDMTVCPRLPIGVHHLWHGLNGLMLGWMIEVYRRHRLAAPRAAQ